MAMSLENVDKTIGSNFRVVKKRMLSIISQTGKTKNVPESDQTSLLIKEEKHIGEIKYKTLLSEKEKFKLFFY